MATNGHAEPQRTTTLRVALDDPGVMQLAVATAALRSIAATRRAGDAVAYARAALDALHALDADDDDVS